MTVLLACVALVSLAVIGFAGVVAVGVVRERRRWRRTRPLGRPIVTLAPDGDDVEDADVGDVSACLQVWLDERWNERFG